mmetsp:Transcript_21859/g.45539  ORF Transcript_21859/g.45539 Transcript_21859/m.45539 type:complete len:254 (+) Transcript_21859:99-860(+)|eukprot:CAMPEP_0118646556 /NCGR_PEP_ID=MMETSP0785-20121206/8125_1 /TAXON_ID=91992 /ORGANISM="Bolidomonas pacifica, Strain CCMP 1866" /LENGTH=253 /DNA_ID=CAMNT_0006538569 /DNA_START=90 /DNA_END=851 /DNA_ORIENTATION=+
MASSGSGYDLSPTTFSPDGRIFQVEYASKAVSSSGTSVGIKCADGVVMVTEKLLGNKMLVGGSGRRVHGVDRHMGCCVTGLLSDGRQLVSRSRSESSNYEETYGIKGPPGVICERIAGFAHYFTMHGALRPFGATVMVAGFDEDTKEYSLHMIEPSGVSYRYYGCSAGKGRQGAKTELEKLDLETITCEEGLKQAVKIICQMRDEGKDKPMEIEAGWVRDGKWERVKDGKVSEIEKICKEELEEEEEDMEEDE